MRRRGLTPSTRLLAAELDDPPADVAKALDLAVDGQAWRVDRVRLADGQPIAIENGWYPKALLPGLDRHDLGGSLYALFDDVYDLGIDHAEQTLWGESADAVTARRLDAPVNTPLLVFRRVSYADARPVEYVVSRYRGDRYQLHMSLDVGSDARKHRNHRRELSMTTTDATAEKGGRRSEPRARPEVRSQPDAADREPARRGPPPAARSGRPARRRRPRLGPRGRRRRRRRQRLVRVPAAALRGRRGDRHGQEVRRLDGARRGRRLPRLQGRR